MGYVVNAVLVNCIFGGVVRDVFPVGFVPGGIKFQENLLFGVVVRFRLVIWFEP
jgi:hypothetical protein